MIRILPSRIKVPATAIVTSFLCKQYSTKDMVDVVNTIIPNSYKNNSNPAYDPSCQPVDATRVNKVNLNRF